MPNHTPQNKGSATSDFVEWYLGRGFGSMNKNDFEVWIFNYLLKTKCYEMSNYEVSVWLKIPESKVKRLRYEAELRYSTANEDERKEQLAEKIRHAHFEKTKGGQIRFSIDNKVLRSYLQDVLTRDGRFYDSSFVSSIVVLSVSDFLYLLQQVYLDDWKDMVKKAKRDTNEPNDFPKTFAEALGDAGKGFCAKLLDRVAGEGAQGFIACAKIVYKEIINKGDNK